MFRILVVDDEEMVRDGLCDIIQYLNLEAIASIETAIDGQDALNKIEENAPHIVITDLNMPNMDGLTLIQHIVERSLSLKMIVISGYDEFHLVKESFKLGITDYLLKPVHTEDLREALVNSMNSLQEEQQLQLRGIVEQSQSSIERNSVQLNFLIDNVDANENDYEQLFVKQELQLPYEQLMVAIITMLERQSESVSWQMKLAVDLLGSSKDSKQLVIYPMFNKNHDLVLWMNYNEQPDMKVFVQHIRENYSDSMFIVACGQAYPRQGYYQRAYQAAFNVSRYKIVSRAFSIIDERIYTNRSMHHMDNDTMKRLVDIVDCGRKEEVQQFIEHNLSDQRLGEYTVEAMESMYDTIMRIIQWLPNKKRSIYSFDQPEQLRIYVKTCIFQTMDARREVLLGSNMIEVAKRYVQEHLLDEINMAVVANYCNVSYHHFSKLFKDSVGMNFQEFVTKSRMEYAKKALQGLNVKIHEVASQLGYNNPKNFTRVFKNYYGMTPKDYQEFLNLK